LKKEFPEKEFYALSPCVICDDMKKITLESVRDALKLRQYEVKLDAETIEKARKPIERMLNTK
jgi:quinolinate synthase